jgi:Tfp pilus assembly protein PilE
MTLILLIVVVILSIVICVKSSKWKNSVSVKDFGDPAKAQMASQMDCKKQIKKNYGWKFYLK